MNTAKAMRGELLIVAAIVLGLAGYAHCQSQVPLANTVQMSDHAQHAAPGALATPQSLLEPNAVTFAHGEMPNGDLPHKVATPREPLGDVARRYRKGFVLGLFFGTTRVYELQGGQQ